MGVNVKLREKKISGGRRSLILDYSPPIENPKTGKLMRFETLKIHIMEKPRTAKEKNENLTKKTHAQRICNKRWSELNVLDAMTDHEQEQYKIAQRLNGDFLAYYKEQAKKTKGSNHDSWRISLMHFENYLNNDSISFKGLSVVFCEDYRDYLLRAKSLKDRNAFISQNTAQSYFNKFKAVLKKAFREGILPQDIGSRVDRIKEEETEVNFLTLEEVQKLAQTSCDDEVLKTASLFAILTGLRFSGIQHLKWKNIISNNGGNHFLKYRQEKTKTADNHPISQLVLDIIGERQDDESPVFKGLMYSHIQNKAFKQWLAESGIKRRITFHCFRHTYATLTLMKTDNVHTVSKMLGHKNIKNTMRYAKVVDEQKTKAANAIEIKL